MSLRKISSTAYVLGAAVDLLANGEGDGKTTVRPVDSPRQQRGAYSLKLFQLTGCFGLYSVF